MMHNQSKEWARAGIVYISNYIMLIYFWLI